MRVVSHTTPAFLLSLSLFLDPHQGSVGLHWSAGAPARATFSSIHWSGRNRKEVGRGRELIRRRRLCQTHSARASCALTPSNSVNIDKSLVPGREMCTIKLLALDVLRICIV